ncbi:MAG: LamG-like jellyroll fold domain-containing protein [Candidatus Peregrinibacteria bacterium]
MFAVFGITPNALADNFAFQAPVGGNVLFLVQGAAKPFVSATVTDASLPYTGTNNISCQLHSDSTVSAVFINGVSCVKGVSSVVLPNYDFSVNHGNGVSILESTVAFSGDIDGYAEVDLSVDGKPISGNFLVANAPVSFVGTPNFNLVADNINTLNLTTNPLFSYRKPASAYEDVPFTLNDPITDVFAYDTTADTIVGGWKTDPSLSWYSEPKDDASDHICDFRTGDGDGDPRGGADNRCGESAFPDQIFIAITAQELFIFDARNGGLWMKVPRKDFGILDSDPTVSLHSVTALNGKIYVAHSGGQGVGVLDFINDTGYRYKSDGKKTWAGTGIADRTANYSAYAPSSPSPFLLGNDIKDIAVKEVSNKIFLAVASTTGLTVINETDGLFFGANANAYTKNIPVSPLLDVHFDEKGNLWVAYTAGGKTFLTEHLNASLLPGALSEDLTLASDTELLSGTPVHRALTSAQNGKIFWAHSAGVTEIYDPAVFGTLGVRKMTPTTATIPMFAGILGHWTNTETDMSGHGNTLTNASGVAWSAVDSGSEATALSFTGSQILSSSSANFNLAGDFTFGAWVKIPAVGTEEAVMGKWNTSGNQRSYLLKILADGKVAASLSPNGIAETTVTSIGALPANTWHFVAGRYNGTRLDVFIDGVLEANVPATGALFSSSSSFVLGASGSNKGLPFTGNIAFPFIANQAYSNTQMQEIVNVSSSFFLPSAHISLFGNSANITDAQCSLVLLKCFLGSSDAVTTISLSSDTTEQNGSGGATFLAATESFFGGKSSGSAGIYSQKNKILKKYWYSVADVFDITDSAANILQNVDIDSLIPGTQIKPSLLGQISLSLKSVPISASDTVKVSMNSRDVPSGITKVIPISRWNLLPKPAISKMTSFVADVVSGGDVLDTTPNFFFDLYGKDDAWNKVSYELQISDLPQSSFTTTLYSQKDLSFSTISPAGSLSPNLSEGVKKSFTIPAGVLDLGGNSVKSFSARVRSHDEIGRYSSWSDIFSFQLNRNVPPSPPSDFEFKTMSGVKFNPTQDGLYSDAMEISFTIKDANAPAEKIGYEIDISSLVDFSSLFSHIASPVTLDNGRYSATVSGLFPNTYHIRMRTIDGAGNVSDYMSKTVSVKIPDSTYLYQKARDFQNISRPEVFVNDVSSPCSTSNDDYHCGTIYDRWPKFGFTLPNITSYSASTFQSVGGSGIFNVVDSVANVVALKTSLVSFSDLEVNDSFFRGKISTAEYGKIYLSNDTVPALLQPYFTGSQSLQVVNDGQGHFSGKAWSEGFGWIDFFGGNGNAACTTPTAITESGRQANKTDPFGTPDFGLCINNQRMFQGIARVRHRMVAKSEMDTIFGNGNDSQWNGFFMDSAKTGFLVFKPSITTSSFSPLVDVNKKNALTAIFNETGGELRFSDSSITEDKFAQTSWKGGLPISINVDTSKTYFFVNGQQVGNFSARGQVLRFTAGEWKYVSNTPVNSIADINAALTSFSADTPIAFLYNVQNGDSRTDLYNALSPFGATNQIYSLPDNGIYFFMGKKGRASPYYEDFSSSGAAFEYAYTPDMDAILVDGKKFFKLSGNGYIEGLKEIVFSHGVPGAQGKVDAKLSDTPPKIPVQFSVNAGGSTSVNAGDSTNVTINNNPYGSISGGNNYRVFQLAPIFWNNVSSFEFDTATLVGAQNLYSYLKGLPDGTPIILQTNTNARANNDIFRNALLDFGVNAPLLYSLNVGDGYLLVAVKGAVSPYYEKSDGADPVSSSYANPLNVSYNPAIDSHEGFIGKVWSNAGGWIYLDSDDHFGSLNKNTANDPNGPIDDYGVTVGTQNDGTGALFFEGKAWSPIMGWFVFRGGSGIHDGNCNSKISPSPLNWGVCMDKQGNFHGYAWNVNFGWLNMATVTAQNADSNVGFSLLISKDSSFHNQIINYQVPVSNPGDHLVTTEEIHSAVNKAACPLGNRTDTTCSFDYGKYYWRVKTLLRSGDPSDGNVVRTFNLQPYKPEISSSSTTTEYNCPDPITDLNPRFDFYIKDRNEPTLPVEYRINFYSDPKTSDLLPIGISSSQVGGSGAASSLSHRGPHSIVTPMKLGSTPPPPDFFDGYNGQTLWYDIWAKNSKGVESRTQQRCPIKPQRFEVHLVDPYSKPNEVVNFPRNTPFQFRVDSFKGDKYSYSLEVRASTNASGNSTGTEANVWFNLATPPLVPSVNGKGENVDTSSHTFSESIAGLPVNTELCWRVKAVSDTGMEDTSDISCFRSENQSPSFVIPHSNPQYSTVEMINTDENYFWNEDVPLIASGITDDQRPGFRFKLYDDSDVVNVHYKIESRSFNEEANITENSTVVTGIIDPSWIPLGSFVTGSGVVPNSHIVSIQPGIGFTLDKAITTTATKTVLTITPYKTEGIVRSTDTNDIKLIRSGGTHEKSKLFIPEDHLLPTMSQVYYFSIVATDEEGLSSQTVSGHFSYYSYGGSGLGNIGTQQITMDSILANATPTHAKEAHRFGWNSYTGWTDFNPTAGGVYVAPEALYGYAWNSQVGWMRFSCENNNPAKYPEGNPMQSLNDGPSEGYDTLYCTDGMNFQRKYGVQPGYLQPNLTASAGMKAPDDTQDFIGKARVMKMKEKCQDNPSSLCGYVYFDAATYLQDYPSGAQAAQWPLNAHGRKAVAVDTHGYISGFAWSPEVGWISMRTRPEGVSLDANTSPDLAVLQSDAAKRAEDFYFPITEYSPIATECTPDIPGGKQVVLEYSDARQYKIAKSCTGKAFIASTPKHPLVLTAKRTVPNGASYPLTTTYTEGNTVAIVSLEGLPVGEVLEITGTIPQNNGNDLVILESAPIKIKIIADSVPYWGPNRSTFEILNQNALANGKDSERGKVTLKDHYGNSIKDEYHINGEKIRSVKTEVQVKNTIRADQSNANGGWGSAIKDANITVSLNNANIANSSYFSLETLENNPYTGKLYSFKRVVTGTENDFMGDASFSFSSYAPTTPSIPEGLAQDDILKVENIKVSIKNPNATYGTPFDNDYFGDENGILFNNDYLGETTGKIRFPNVILSNGDYPKDGEKRVITFESVTDATYSPSGKFQFQSPFKGTYTFSAPFDEESGDPVPYQFLISQNSSTQPGVPLFNTSNINDFSFLHCLEPSPESGTLTVGAIKAIVNSNDAQRKDSTDYSGSNQCYEITTNENNRPFQTYTGNEFGIDLDSEVPQTAPNNFSLEARNVSSVSVDEVKISAKVSYTINKTSVVYPIYPEGTPASYVGKSKYIKGISYSNDIKNFCGDDMSAQIHDARSATEMRNEIYKNLTGYLKEGGGSANMSPASVSVRISSSELQNWLAGTSNTFTSQSVNVISNGKILWIRKDTQSSDALIVELGDGNNIQDDNSTTPRTIVVEGGNIFLKNNIIRTNNKATLAIIALRDFRGVDPAKNSGNILISPDVTNIRSVLFADGSVFSSANGYTVFDGSSNRSSLVNQLYILGGVYSKNTYDGSSSPSAKTAFEGDTNVSHSDAFNVPGDKSSLYPSESIRFDLLKLRDFHRDSLGNVKNSGEAAKENPFDRFGGAWSSRALSTERNSDKSCRAKSSVIIEYDTNLQESLPPGAFERGNVQINQIIR